MIDMNFVCFIFYFILDKEIRIVSIEVDKKFSEFEVEVRYFK